MIRATGEKNSTAESTRDSWSAESSSLSRGAPQTKLRVSKPGDASELEAERLAEHVMSAQPLGSLADAAARPGIIPRAADDSRAPVNAREPFVPHAGGEPLPARARDFFEPRFGRDLGDVRVHTGADAAGAAKALAARGYAVGRHVIFGAGQFAPGTPAGDRLLAHELAHVIFGAHEPVVHRAPESAFDINVPAPADVAFAPGIQYPWQNPELRETIYPYRDELLSYFLRTYMEIDLDDPAVASKMKTASELEVSRLAEIAVLDVESELDPANKPKPERARTLKARRAELKAVETESASAFSKKGQETQRAAFTELMRLEHERDVNESLLADDPSTATGVDKQIDDAARKKLAELAPLIKEAEARIGPRALSQVRQKMKAAENRRRAAVVEQEMEPEIEKLNKELKDVGEQIKDAEVKIIAARNAKDPEKTRETELRAKPLYFRRTRLQDDLDYLTKWQPVSLEKRLAAYQYSKFDDTGAELTHDELLARILDRFDADKTFTRYPKWLRYMVVHFSGMRYESAHGSYASPTELVRRLKREQVKTEMKTASELEVSRLAEIAVLDVESELDPANKPKPERARALKARRAELKAVETESASAFSKKGQETQRAAFTELLKLEHEREVSTSELADDPSTATGVDKLFDDAARKKLAELAPLIKEAVGKIDPKALSQVRQKMKAAENRRRAAVVEQELGNAAAALADLDDMQAVAVLKAMHAEGAFPDWVWRKIVRATPLKLEAEEGEDWEKKTSEELQVETGKKRDPVTLRWKSIMDEWLKDATGWRTRHGQDLSLVVIRAVCNEISEMSLHARGVKPRAGIRHKAGWYATPGTGRTFSRPKSNADLKPGASLFFMEWQKNPPKYPEIGVVESDTVELKSDKDELISNGFADADRWKYKFHPDKSVSRTRVIEPRPAPSTVDMYETQYLNWIHEAQVVEVDDKRKRVLTFETGPIGLRTRWLKEVVNAWNVYAGYAPSGTDPADLDKYLTDILPGRQLP